MASANLTHEAEHSQLVLWDNQRDRMGRLMAGGVQDGGGDTCVPVADSCRCMAKTITIL